MTMKGLFKKLSDFLASYLFAVVLLGFLFVLTLIGTLEQQYTGLYEVQKKYFNSLYLVEELGPVPIVLPGAALVLGLLAINLIAGGLIRIRWSKRTAGVIIIHIGMAMMLLAGLVKLKWADEGHLTLFEGERSNEYVSYYEWEVAVFDLSQGEQVDEYLIRDLEFTDLTGNREATFDHPDLPFQLALSRFEKNARAMPKGPMWETEHPVVDGYALRAMPLEVEAERNVAGLYATVRAPGEEEQAGILSGWERFPWVFEAGGRRWGMTLRHRTFPMPFTIHLDDFTRELHPGTGMAASYMSDVTMLRDGQERPVRIQMNEPLREDGLILFQSSWGPQNARPGQPLFSTFSVVRNPSDHWPLYSLIVMGVGLAITFMQKLIGYMRSQAKRRTKPAPSKAPASRAQAAALLALVGLLPLLGGCSQEPEPGTFEPARSEPWPQEVVDLAAEWTVQSGGRVKPLSTHAGFQLLRMNGKRTVVTPATPEGTVEKLTPTEWVLDCFFYPEDAVHYEMFRVDDSDVLVGVGLEGKEKRDWYSYRELAPGRESLREKARELHGEEDKDLTPLQRQTRNLYSNLVAFEDLISFLDFARDRFGVDGSAGMRELFGGAEEVTLSQLLARADEVLDHWKVMSDPEDQRAATELTRHLDFYSQRAPYSLALVAPSEELTDHPPHEGHDEHEEENVYFSPTGLIATAFNHPHPEHSTGVRVLALLEMLTDQRDRPAEFAATMRQFHGELKSAAAARGEFAKIPAEVSFYKTDYFTNALALYLLGFLLIAVSWMRPDSVWLQRGIWLSLGAATLLLCVGIGVRCYLRSRPPVSTLYETILFITACAVLVAMFIEYVNRQRIALVVASVLGAIGMFLSMRYELKEAATAGDTMPSLVAVLDTNFWLATHVTTVTMGYAAGLLAAALAHVWIFGKLFGLKKGDPEFYRSLTKTTYGVLCFGLFFSIVGTVLGGIWANYSWGRFWGWDPKENGALLICLSMLMILHARLGGYIKQFGIAVSSILCGLVVAFSWWGVNLLGIGLHSYGFTSGIFLTLVIFYGVEAVVLLLGAGWWFHERALQKAHPSQSAQSGSAG